MRRVKKQLVYRFLEMIEPLNKRERTDLVAALVRRFHPGTLAPPSESFAVKERELLNRYLEYDHAEILPGIHARLPIWRDDQEKRLLTPQDPFRMAKVDRKKLKTAVVARLTPICGGNVGSYGGNSFFFATSIGAWRVQTEIGTGSRLYHLRYRHRVMASSGHMIVCDLTLLRWLGIAGETYWQLSGDSEIGEAADSLADICAHFLNNARQVLSESTPKPKQM